MMNKEGSNNKESVRLDVGKCLVMYEIGVLELLIAIDKIEKIT